MGLLSTKKNTFAFGDTLKRKSDKLKISRVHSICHWPVFCSSSHHKDANLAERTEANQFSRKGKQNSPAEFWCKNQHQSS